MFAALLVPVLTCVVVRTQAIGVVILAALDLQRAAFNDVSVNLWKVVEKAEKMDAPVYYQYCPMKNGYWLSKEKDIKNPYYGSSMLTCGKVVETKL